MPSGRSVVARTFGSGVAGSVAGSIIAAVLLNQSDATAVRHDQTIGSIVPDLVMFSMPGTLIGAGALTLIYAALPTRLSHARRALALLFIGLFIGMIVPALPFLIGGKLIGVAIFGGFGAFYAFCTILFWLLLAYRADPKDGS